jgi:hypothetical protein
MYDILIKYVIVFNVDCKTDKHVFLLKIILLCMPCSAILNYKNVL